MQDFAYQHPSTISLGNPQMTGKKVDSMHSSLPKSPCAEMVLFFGRGKKNYHGRSRRPVKGMETHSNILAEKWIDMNWQRLKIIWRRFSYGFSSKQTSIQNLFRLHLDQPSSKSGDQGSLDVTENLHINPEVKKWIHVYRWSSSAIHQKHWFSNFPKVGNTDSWPGRQYKYHHGGSTNGN